MKIVLRHLVLLCALFLWGAGANAQIAGGTYNIPGNYNTLAEAVTALNTQGVSGNVIINMLPGNPETAPAGGYQLGSATLNASVAANRTITIRGNGNMITAQQCSGCVAATIRGIFFITGVDYLTIDSLNLQENSLNTTVNTRMNWGYALVKLNASDGCHNVTIRKCIITMDLAQTNALGAGIYTGNHLVTATTALTPTAVAGTHSNNLFTNNVITARRGVLMNGYNAPVGSRPGLFDQENTISDNELHFGVSAANASFVAAGVHVQYQHNLQVTNNKFDNLNGASVIGNSPTYGVYFNTTNDVNLTCRDNIFELSTAHNTAVIQGIHSRIQGDGTVTFSNNIFRNFNFTHANGHSSQWADATVFIEQVNVVRDLHVTDNQAVNNTGLRKAGQFCMFRYGFQGAGLAAAVPTDSVNARITGNRMQHFGQLIHNPAASVNQQMLFLDFISIEFPTNDIAKPGRITVSNNELSDVSLSMGRFWGILGGYSGQDFEIAHNTFARISSVGNDNAEDIVIGGGPIEHLIGANVTVRNNVIRDISRDGGVFRGIAIGMSRRYFSDWGTPFAPPMPGSVVHCHNNLISNISVLNSTRATGTVGMWITGGENYVYNNFITDIMHNVSITGIDMGMYGIPQYSYQDPETQLDHSKSRIYNNTIKIGEIATPLSGVSVHGIVYSQQNDTSDIRNNIIHINATGGSFYHVACIKGLYSYRLHSTVAQHGSPGVSPPAGVNLNNNLYYVPAGINTYIYVEDSVNNLTNTLLRNGFGIGGLVENPTRHLFNDPGFNTLCSGYKPFIGSGREQGSFWESSLVPGSVFGTYAPSGPSFAKSNAALIATPPITTDFAGVSRGSAPDMGALQFTGSVPSSTPPVITITQTMPLITYCTDAAAVGAHITAAGGLNTTTGTAPRLYYKKASETNAFGNYPAQNNASFDGWKYVEAIGTAPNFIFNIDYNRLHSPIAAGDSITYFVIAQDNASTPNVAVNIAGFSSGCNLPGVNLNPSIGATTAMPVSRGYRILSLPVMTATAGQAQYCMNGVAHLKLISLPQGATAQWQEDRGTGGSTWFDIPGANGIDYVSGTLIANNSYRAVIRCNSVVVATSNEVPIIISGTPAPTNVFPGHRCGSGPVTLRASSPGHSLIWYETLSGGGSLHRGDTFVTPSLTLSRDYYVSAYNTLVSGQHIGIVAPSGSVSSGTANNGLKFDALNPFILDSVSIFPSSGSLGDIYIKLVDSSGTVLQTKTINAGPLQLNVANRIHLGFHIPAGVNHRLVMDGPGGNIPNFRYQSSAVGFPREAQGIVSIKEGISTSGIWYYFFDWVISTGCESATRTPVRAIISPAPAMTAAATNPVICNGDATTLTVTSGNAGYTYQWVPGSLSGSAVTVSPSVTTTYYVTATDNTGGVFSGCANSDSVTVTVNPSPVSFFNYNGNTTFCYGADSLLLTAGGTAGGYQWQRNGINISGAVAPDYMARDSGSYQLVMKDGSCADTSGELILTVYSLPVPVIVMNGNELTVDKPYSSYQWYWNGQLIPGATSATYHVIQNGRYTVRVEDGNNCAGMSAELPFALDVSDVTTPAAGVHIYPNPASTVVHIDAPYPVRVTVSSVDGKTVLSRAETNRLDLSHLVDGVYMIRVEDRNGVLVGMEKLVKIMR